MATMTVHDDDDFDLLPSKSEQKRAMERLQELGERLMTLKPADWAKLPLSEALHAALRETARIKGMEAQRRHRQYIGRLMRSEDENALLAILNRKKDPRLGRQLEQLQQRLLERGDGVITEVLERFPQAERHTLRQLVRAAQKEAASAVPDAPAGEQQKKLLTYLQELAALAE